ncbi:hypothetical protein BCR37DRAFT_393758 [Protomyces lactucae-debilis]|uniref:Uncharacterized protein n=1 Tax=Protomyces lactucae-debilis TaxID=2754530 RepID=A0A1Y2FC13_PROLT|nr:uncharacterized protein BCR37DRAFT_393758 [Protomyces lactucae-debilis]ORY80395.1 hypothetical protein BCR37DRAFT_393758 [Protomyces lactucae-debilis]
MSNAATAGPSLKALQSPSRPLDQVKSHQRHARKTSKMSGNIPLDDIDQLDVTGLLGYHHEGPFDATLAARQVPGYAPLDAVQYGNNLAMRATGQSKMDEVMRGHIPLDGVASVAPGERDSTGELLDYEDENVERGEGMDNQGSGARPASGVADDDVSELGKWIDGDISGSSTRPTTGSSIAMKSKHKKQVSIAGEHGIVEYDPELDEDEAPTASSSGTTGLFGSLKKRLSIKR